MVPLMTLPAKRLQVAFIVLITILVNRDDMVRHLNHMATPGAEWMLALVHPGKLRPVRVIASHTCRIPIILALWLMLDAKVSLLCVVAATVASACFWCSSWHYFMRPSSLFLSPLAPIFYLLFFYLDLILYRLLLGLAMY